MLAKLLQLPPSIMMRTERSFTTPFVWNKLCLWFCSTFFTCTLNDEDIPDQAKDPGGEAEPQDQTKEPGEGAEAKTKKIPASGHGTTAPGSGTTVPGTVLPPWAAVLPCHGSTARTTAPYYRRRTETFTVVGHGTTVPR